MNSSINWLCNKRSAVWLVLFVATLSVALQAGADSNQQCLQLLQRTEACPHVIYKKTRLAVPVLKVPANSVICVCLSDLEAVLHTPQTALEPLERDQILNEISQQYQLSEKEIFSIIRD